MEKPEAAPTRLNRRKIFVILLVLALAPLAFLAYTIFAPLFGRVFCTLETCLQASGITIVFVDQKKSQNYSILLESSSTSQRIDCSPSDLNLEQLPYRPYDDQCILGGAFFHRVSNYPPEEVTVSVFINDYTITKKFRPVYRKVQPFSDNQNGTANCSPACYWATIEFDLSP